MPRYYFHTDLGDDVIADDAGVELRDPDHAWEVARDTIRATMASTKSQARLMSARLVVTDEAGEVVLEFPFSEGIEAPEPDPGTVH
ncbi:DUF6894 family protein [Methylobacterium sp. sgz302541]|uniref:DUF6894 family protein n=1 Tax=unclassified Methylobacterium TaxID=2615210 RepID=UPI003D33BE43